jgi:hypothetical protein
MDKQKLARNGGFLGICVLGIGLAIGYGRHLLRVDPFARFSHDAPNSKSILAKLDDVDMVKYHKDQLVGKAHVGELDIRQDQTNFDLEKVYDGTMMTDQGKVQFSADSANWDAGRLYLTVNGGAHITDKDFDLHVPGFSLDQRSGNLVVPREIRGRFFGGEISAKEFMYNVNSKDGHVGPATWVGKPNLQEETGSPQNTAWTFQTNGATLHHGDIETWHEATATDGNVVVQAPVIERNTKSDVITATGGCLYFSNKSDMACDKVVVYRKDKRAVLSGNVRMLIKPKDEMEKKVKADLGEIPVFHPQVPASVAATAPIQGQSAEDQALDDEVRSGKSTRKYPTVVLAENVEYWYAKGNRHANITGDPQATQALANGRWRRVWATTGTYDGEADSITLKKGDKSEVQMKNSTGDDIMAKSFTFSTLEDNEDWEGVGMHGVVMGDSSQDNGQPGTTTPPATKTPPAVKTQPMKSTAKPADQDKKPPVVEPKMPGG